MYLPTYVSIFSPKTFINHKIRIIIPQLLNPETPVNNIFAVSLTLHLHFYLSIISTPHPGLLPI